MGYELFDDKKSIADFSDRELLETILMNQIEMHRQILYLEQRVRTGEVDSLGPDYTNSIWQLTNSHDTAQEGLEKYLNGELNFYHE